MEEQLEIVQFLKIIAKRKGIVVIGTALCVLLAVIATMYMTPRYDATAKILVAQAQAPLNDQSSSESYQAVLLSQQLAKTFSEIMVSRTLAERVITRLELPLLPDDLMKKVKAQPIRDTQLIVLKVTDVDPKRAKDIANTYADEFIAFIPSTAPGASQMKVSMVESAIVALQPVTPKPLLNTVLAFMLGLSMSIGFAFVLEKLDVTVKEPEMLEQLLGITSLGLVPKSQQPLLLGDNNTDTSESMRRIRTNLQYLNFDQSIRSFAVTSPETGDGKTTLASNLAMVFAQAGQNVLLVDCDLRRPSIGKVFHLREAPGLSNVLIGAADADSVVVASGVDGLSIVTSGPIPPNPADLLNSERMDDLLARFESRFDIVILDCPPVPALSDTVILASKADAVLMVSSFGRSKKADMLAARNALAKVGARILGFVINGARTSKQNGYYNQPYTSRQALRDALRNLPRDIRGG
ncbi:MAG: polysaccharide biosynthesis tyrosine autokinase [Actinobacteria bacterium]|nr:polysaccharide biosynthesis tyrosine autokinase [Actinomycetota bacterium]